MEQALQRVAGLFAFQVHSLGVRPSFVDEMAIPLLHACDFIAEVWGTEEGEQKCGAQAAM